MQVNMETKFRLLNRQAERLKQPGQESEFNQLVSRNLVDEAFVDSSETPELGRFSESAALISNVVKDPVLKKEFLSRTLERLQSAYATGVQSAPIGCVGVALCEVASKTLHEAKVPLADQVSLEKAVIREVRLTSDSMNEKNIPSLIVAEQTATAVQGSSSLVEQDSLMRNAIWLIADPTL